MPTEQKLEQVGSVVWLGSDGVYWNKDVTYKLFKNRDIYYVSNHSNGELMSMGNDINSYRSIFKIKTIKEEHSAKFDERIDAIIG